MHKNRKVKILMKKEYKNNNKKRQRNKAEKVRGNYKRVNINK